MRYSLFQVLRSRTSELIRFATFRRLPSQEWFGSNIQEFASAVSRFGASDSSLALPDSSVQTLLEKAKDFEDLADTCLLVLHLEVPSANVSIVFVGTRSRDRLFVAWTEWSIFLVSRCAFTVSTIWCRWVARLSFG